ncbi:MAG: LamG domain-containing protein, partial [Candidatus Paceibacterota bacterium]
AEGYNDWLNGLDENVVITGWTSSPFLYPVLRTAKTITAPKVVYWNFNAGSGTSVLDNSGNGCSLQFKGSPTWQAGKIGSSVELNGSSYMNSSVSPVITGPFTIGIWLYRTGTGGGNNSVIEIGGHAPNTGFGIWINSSNQLGWRINQDYQHYKSDLVPTLNTWEYFTLVYDGTTIKFYKNGALVTTDNFTTNPIAVANSLTIGARDTGTEYYVGRVDGAFICTGALSAAEITALYNNGDGRELSTKTQFLVKPSTTLTSAAIKVSSDYARVVDIEVDGSNYSGAGNTDGALCYAASTSYWNNNIIRDAGGDNHGIKLTGGKEYYIYNNFIIDDGDTGEAGIEVNNSGGNAYIYSNSITACDKGINVTAGTVIAKDNAVLGNTTDFSGTFDATSGYNASSDTTAPGTNPVTSITAANNFTSVTANAEDLHLKSGGGCIGAGTNLSADSNLAVTTDIDGIARFGVWDIGADKLDNIWTNSSSDGLWKTAANWTLGLPAAGQSIVFNKTSTSNCNVASGGTLVPNNLGALSLMGNYTGTVTFQKNATTSPMVLSVTSSVNVNSGNLIFVGDTTLDPPNGGGYEILAGDITVALGASINADYKGFGSQLGPGAGAGASYGSSHGGKGGCVSQSVTTGIANTYGDFIHPTALGSGGNMIWDLGGEGGGALKLSASGNIVINGTLSVNGLNGKANNYSCPGGTGGSIWIASGNLTGSGSIKANGGAGLGGAGGSGGGRIDLSGASSVAPTLLIQALGGGIDNGMGRGGFSGTIVFPAGYFDNFTPTSNFTFGHGITFGNVIINSGITLTLDANADDYTYDFANLTIKTGGKLVLLGNPFIVNGGTNTYPNGGVGVTINAQSITVETGASIDASGQGFTNYHSGRVGGGPGGGTGYNDNSWGGFGGGSHGGKGGNGSTAGTGGDIYGSIVGPFELGSSGSGYYSAPAPGGGAIHLVVAGGLVVNGAINANGGANVSERTGSGGAAGGSIWIKTSGALSGSGTITANGANSGGGGGGGGGRVRVEYASSTFPSANIIATGGTGYQSGASGLLTEVNTSNANTAPAAPMLSSPIDASTLISTSPTFLFSATDAEYDYLKFKIEIATDSGFSSIVQTIDQTASQTGWYGQTEQAGTAYDYGRAATYILQTALSANTQYYWRVSATDPGGSQTWGSASSSRTFTTTSGAGNYWKNTSGNGLWSSANDATNWSLGHKPVAGEYVSFIGHLSNTDCTFDVYADLSGSLASLTLDSSYLKTLTLKKVNSTTGPGILTITGDITVNGGNIVCQGNPSAIGAGTASVPYGEGIVLNAANITVASGATLNANGKGFSIIHGPCWVAGITAYGNGGSYGGRGDPISVIYGSVASPTALGSGGSYGMNGSQDYDGSGGGAIKIVSSGTITVNGILSANGNNGNGNFGAGSGGSVWIASGTITGAGTISANGGSAGNANNAGGGRIDISGATNNFAGSYQVSSPATGFGTIVFPQSTGTSATLDNFVVNNSLTLGNSSLTLGAITIQSGGTLSLREGAGIQGGIVSATTVTVNSGGVLNFYRNNNEVEDTLNFTTLTVNAGGTINVYGNSKVINAASGGTSSNPHGAGRTINATNITVAETGSINANGKGFYTMEGPGWSFVPNYYQGGSYGGLGSVGTMTYGSASSPTALGTAGCYTMNGGRQNDASGGGAIKIVSTGTMTVNGTISANGVSLWDYSGCGAGGSVWIVANALTGGATGVISANGGSGSGGGGGGRINVTYNTKTYTGAVTVNGGTGPNSRAGANGTIAYNGVTEFICKIKASGGDYASINAWNTAVKCDLTAATTKVFSHFGITGTITDGTTVTGLTSGASASVKHATATQILLTGISGTFQVGETVQVTGGNNVVLRDKGTSAIAVAECYNDWPNGLDENVNITGWTANSGLYPIVRPALGVRYSGSYHSGFYLKPATNLTSAAIKISSDYARIEGLEVDGSNYAGDSTDGGLCYADGISYWNGNLIHSGTTYGLTLAGTNKSHYVWNNFFTNNLGVLRIGIAVRGAGAAYIYNNSVTGYWSGIWREAGVVVAKNNACLGTNSESFVGTFDASSDYNASSDTLAPGDHSVKSITAANNFTSTTAGSEDLHLKAGSALIGTGTPTTLFNDPIVTDIDGLPRFGTWDIGADKIDNVWKNTTADGLWATAANWSLGLPAAGQSIVFNKTSNTPCTVATGSIVPD